MKIIGAAAQVGGFRSLGDCVACTALPRAIRRRWPRERIEFPGFVRPELFEGNPFMSGGDEETRGLVKLEFGGPHRDSGNFVRKFGLQVGVDIIDDTPELFLSDQEKAIDFGITDWTKTVCVDVWANWESRRWPIENFRRLSTRLMSAGWKVLEIGKGPRPSIPCTQSFLDKLSVRQTAALLSRCSLYFGNDSGCLYLAAAVGTPQVIAVAVLPWWRVSFWNTTPVRPARGCDCGGAGTCKAGPIPRCLREISVDYALEAVRVAHSRYPRNVGRR